jgi:hypothetical protein
MPTNTDNGTYPLPTGTDPPDVPYWLDQLAQAVENKALVHNSTTRKRVHLVVGLSGTTDANAYLTVTHGAGFTPRIVLPQIMNVGVHLGVPFAVGAVTSTTAVLRFFNWTSANMFNNAAVSGIALVCFE